MVLGVMLMLLVCMYVIRFVLYKCWVVFIVWCVFMLNLWFVFCCRVEVIKGGDGFWLVGLVLIEWMVKLWLLIVVIVILVCFVEVMLNFLSFLFVKFVSWVLNFCLWILVKSVLIV